MYGGLVAPVALRLLLCDAATLAKLRITLLSVATAATGMILANSSIAFYQFMSLLGIALVVAAANVFNMYIEAPFDARMLRTSQRPLPAGRWQPAWVWAWGCSLLLGSCVLLATCANVLTLCIGLGAFALYLFGYTPLKRKTSFALFVGAVAGAAPPVMGYTAASGRIDAIACILFAILFVWQIPHFLAISILRQQEYSQAGFVMFSQVFGHRVCKWTKLVSAAVLCAVSLLLWRTDACGALYATVAVVVGLWFAAVCAKGFVCSCHTQWARQVFYASLIYPLLLFAAVWVDRSVYFAA
ncbi:MAG: heme o synthase [Myxococcota bacterium]